MGAAPFDLAATVAALAAADGASALGGGSLLDLAARVRAATAGEAAILVAGADRRLYAAALVSALHDGARVVLPHSLGAEALDPLRELTGARGVLGVEHPPAGFARLEVPEAAPSLAEAPLRGADERWVALHTGGSTGQSRLFWKSARNLLGEVQAQVLALGLGADDVCLTCVPPHHVYGLLFSVLAPLLSGARVVAAESPYPTDLAQALVAEGATFLVAVPAHYRALGTTSLAGHALRVALSSAAPLDAADAQRFHAQTGVAITELFGSTETGGIATRSQARGDTLWRALADVEWRVEDQRLWVCSPYLSEELRDEAGGYLTADRVTAGEQPETFALAGRVDGVVKVGGVRVELDDVRGALLEVGGIADAFVAAREVDGSRAQELLALFVGTADPAEVRRALASRLNAVAIPRVILRTDRIPTNAAGKVERARVFELFARAGEGDQP